MLVRTEREAGKDAKEQEKKRNKEREEEKKREDYALKFGRCGGGNEGLDSKNTLGTASGVEYPPSLVPV